MRLLPGDRISWGVGRSGTVQDIHGDELEIMDDGWSLSLWTDDSVRSIDTPPFIFTAKQSSLGNLRKIS